MSDPELILKHIFSNRMKGNSDILILSRNGNRNRKSTIMCIYNSTTIEKLRSTIDSSAYYFKNQLRCRRNLMKQKPYLAVSNLFQKMAVRNLFLMSNYQRFFRSFKSPIFSTVSLFFTISVAAIFFIIYENILTSNLSMYPEDTAANKILTAPTTKSKGQLRSTFSSKPLQITTQRKIEGVDRETLDPLIPPFNVTRLERIAWFQKKLPELGLFKSSNFNSQFHDQVLGFFNSSCTIWYFMLWLSPAQSFGPREFSAVDSLFKASPKGCLMILSPSLNSRQGYRILKPLIDGGFKVLAVTPDLPFLVKNTPAEGWLDELKRGSKDPGKIPLSYNLSNLIRLAILYKYGGVYLDVDFIVLKDFTGLRNAIGAQSIDTSTRKWTRINGAAMIFNDNHPLLHDFLEEFALTFDGSKWGHNGPYLVSRVIERIEYAPGYDLTILPPKTFYPMDWIKIARLFKKPETETESKWIEDMLVELNRSTYAIHLWNHRSKELMIEEGSVMDKLISSFCVICQQRNKQPPLGTTIDKILFLNTI
ncbi:uncharacterized protein At4g19900-like [Durio zibethinus]|uniref:Uncharacterized protein At4g19900-like n=1 Tax=Durio zibethinus TaxID=66656 RepID=A0A6P5Z635_DURZI|nr:uncharacterized protein At4g19900-like [Durio zibethinus]